MLTEAPLVKSYRGERLFPTPVWFMRQAGRFLPEYREIRSKHSMLDVIRTPQLASKVTLQPIERFELDAAIIFADILNPLIGMGIELDFVAGEGPRIFNPVRLPDDVKKLIVPPPEENVGYTLEAIKLTTAALNPMGIPLIGFSGAPFTLSAYIIEGKGSQRLSVLKRFMFNYPDAWKSLQEKLAELVADYLIAQVEAGASAVQIFDSWLGVLGPVEFDLFCAPYLKNLISRVKAAIDVPLVYFATGTAGIMAKFAELGADVVGVDWRLSLTEANSLLGENFPLQGNLDPNILSGPSDYLEKEVVRILEESRKIKGYVFNLGHGILPDTPIESVSRVVSLVRRFS